jgi:hypothetical protein
MADEILGHEIKDWLPQEPWQGPPLPEFLNIYWPWYKPPAAQFKVSNLVISPTEAQIGYPVSISCTATNIGSEAGTYTVKMGGDFVATQVVSLEPGQSKVVSFEVTPTVAKTYSVSVNGLSGTFRATTAPVADIRLENLTISPAEVLVGEKVTISVVAKNYGTASGSKVITCEVT